MTKMAERDSDALIPPSSLFVLWPGDEPPMAEEIRVRLGEHGNSEAELDTPGAENTLWSFWFDLSDRPLSYLVWCEPTNDLPKILLDDVLWRSDRQRSDALMAKWMIGIEGPLSLGQPTVDYQTQLRLCDAISRGQAPAIYDANAFAFRAGQELAQLTTERTAPRSACMFTIHKLPMGEPGDRYWVHTHGLERSGIPDLEIFDVPGRYLAAACELMETVAELWIECGTPEPQTPFCVGRELEIAWRPWQAVVSQLTNDSVGGWKHRGEALGHAGSRAVLVSGRIDGWVCRRWSPPTQVLERLTKSQTTLFKTANETQRMSQLARERWSTFGMLFAGRRPPGWRFAVKMSFPIPDDPRHAEHLWFDVLGLRPGQVLARLVSQPVAPLPIAIGQTAWHPFDKLSDWRILTEQGVYSPETADQLFEEAELALSPV